MIDKKKKYKLGDFNYRLPKKLVAQHPDSRRDYSKLMVVHQNSGDIEHKKFYNITDWSVFIAGIIKWPLGGNGKASSKGTHR